MEPIQTVRRAEAFQYLDAANAIYVWLALSRDDNHQWVVRSLILDVLPSSWLARPDEYLLAPWPNTPQVHPFKSAFFYTGLLPRNIVWGWFERPQDCALSGIQTGPGKGSWIVSFMLPDFYPDAAKAHIASHGLSIAKSIPYPCHVYTLTPKITPNAQVEGRSKDEFPLVSATDDDYLNFRHARADLLYRVTNRNEALQRDDACVVRVIDAGGWLQEVRVLPDKVTVTTGGTQILGQAAVKLSGDKLRANKPIDDFHLSLNLQEPLPDLVTVRLVRGQELLDEAEFTSDSYPWPHKSPQVIVEREGFYGYTPPTPVSAPTYAPAEVLATEQVGKAPPIVFISYSQDSAAHKKKVRDLAARLRSDGVNCRLDLYEANPQGGWAAWMDKQIKQSEFVLVICTETYLRRSIGKEEKGRGLGATWESGIIRQAVYEQAGENDKFIPVIFEQEDKQYIPNWLRGPTYYLVADEDKYEELYARLTGRLLNEPPPLGQIRPLRRNTK